MYCTNGLIVPCNTTGASRGDSDLAVASGVEHKERRRAAPGLFNYIKVAAPSCQSTFSTITNIRITKREHSYGQRKEATQK